MPTPTACSSWCWNAGDGSTGSLAAVKIAPSILAADFAELAAEVERVADQADLLHVDCMDGHYVPNLTIGPPVVKSLRARTDLYLDCHLMVTNPGDLLDAFADAGANGCTVHVELGDPRLLFDRIRALGMRVGLSFEPETPYAAVEPYLGEIDVLLVMSVHTGFGGQPFIPAVLDKARAARDAIDARGLAVELEIDGGISPDTVPLAAAAGIDIFVAGTAIFRQPDPAAAARELRAAATAAVVGRK
jgi:ribulose-phosphate 3-epimerase